MGSHYAIVALVAGLDRCKPAWPYRIVARGAGCLAGDIDAHAWGGHANVDRAYAVNGEPRPDRS